MSKNLSDIFPPTEIGGGGGGGIEEAPRDGRMYARQEQQNTGMGWTAFDPGNLDPGTEDDQVLLWHTADDKWSASNTVPAVQSGPTPPFNPVEGTLWMEVPNQGDATMWVYTKDSGGNGRWLQHPGGKDGAPGADGNIADATTNGVIATWDDAAKRWTPEGAVVVSGGNVGIGDAPVGGALVTKVGADNKIAMNTASYAGTEVARISAFDNAVSTGVPLAIEGMDLRLRTDTRDRLTIDATGDSWFYGDVHIAEQITLQKAGGNAHSIKADTNDLIFTSVTGGKESMRLTYDGNATFSGNISASGNVLTGQTLLRPDAGCGGLKFTTLGSIIPTNHTGTNTDGEMNLGTNANQRFKEGHFSGAVYSNGSPLTRTVDLIETLSTLREATKDETTVKGLRDAIGNAVGGLIEKFEAMQSTATQEIDNE